MDSAACPVQRRCSPGPAQSFHALWPPSGDVIILSLNLGFVVKSDRTAEHVLEMWSSSSSLVPPPTASGMDSPPPQRRLPPSTPAGPGAVSGEVRCGAHAHGMRCGLLASLGSAFTYQCPCARENTALNSREKRRTGLRASTGRGGALPHSWNKSRAFVYHTASCQCWCGRRGPSVGLGPTAAMTVLVCHRLSPSGNVKHLTQQFYCEI